MKMSSFSGSQKKNDKLKAAANIHVKIGHMQRYCELMVEIGEVRLYCTEKHVLLADLITLHVIDRRKVCKFPNILKCVCLLTL